MARGGGPSARGRQAGCGRPFFSLARAAFRLGERLVFEGTSWVFCRDEHWAILGANASGKSLLADAVRGRLPLAQGELRYHFRAPPGLTPEEAIGQVSFEIRKGEVPEAVMQSRWNSLEEESGLRVRDFLAYERVMEVNPFEGDGPAPEGPEAFRAAEAPGCRPLKGRAVSGADAHFALQRRTAAGRAGAGAMSSAAPAHPG